jgi:hypothetical protein
MVEDQQGGEWSLSWWRRHVQNLRAYPKQIRIAGRRVNAGGSVGIAHNTAGDAMNRTSNTPGRGIMTGMLTIAAALLIIGMMVAPPKSSETHARSFPQNLRQAPDAGAMAVAARLLPEETAGEHRLSGPYIHKNLTIYLVHGKDKIKGKKYMTLQEALAKKKVVVYETGEVNELLIQNKSDQEVFIQAGDIVKGGRQDRVLGYDLVLAPRSKKIPITSYCVEEGRWSGRSGESDQAFGSSENQIVGRELKLAAKYDNDQSKVWKKVEEAQNKLSEKLGGSVRSEQSESSLELALRHDKVKVSSDEYVKALKSIIDGHNDVIGYVIAINGTVNSADMYASSDLFRKLWPKLLRASVVEAIADYDHGTEFAQPTADSVRATLSDAEGGGVKDTKDMSRSTVVTQESEKNVMFETRDREAGDVWLHRSYLRK